MIRFPNPGSDISSFIRIFKTIFTFLKNKSWFNLDDISLTLTKANLAASSGHVGAKALELSTRDDRSRDPLYNQSKMYAELYRTLGWIVSDDPNNALKFRFTLLGEHVSVADINPKIVFEESVLGINYPNRILSIKGTEASRVFSAILKSAYHLSGFISRDEIIIGILNKDDIDEISINNIVSTIKSFRGHKNKLSDAITNLSKQIGIQINTMQNYTRFPLAVLTYCGWFERVSTKQFYPLLRPTIMFKLTTYGFQKVKELENSIDIRLSEYESQTSINQKALIRVGFYTMLQRANFDITPVISQIAKDQLELKNTEKKEILFSPYQTIRPEIADEALGYYRHIEYSEYVAQPTPKYNDVSSNIQSTTIKLKPLLLNNINSFSGSEIENKIIDLNKQGFTNDKIAEILYKEYASSTKEVFYPLISDLFRIIGFDCKVSRAGINYERWDAIITDSSYSIPIEIKSPTEEQFISIKAIRQALENKIILLSRKSYVTDWNTVSLAVGYNPPNERAEVSRLIEDIKNVFNLRIGLIDFISLIKIAVESLKNNKNDYINIISQMEGIINVEYT